MSIDKYIAELLGAMSYCEYKTSVEIVDEIVRNRLREGGEKKASDSRFYVAVDKLIREGFVEYRKRSFEDVVGYKVEHFLPIEYRLIESSFRKGRK